MIEYSINRTIIYALGEQAHVTRFIVMFALLPLAGPEPVISLRYTYTASDFQPFASHGTHKLITKVLRHTKEYNFCQSDKKIRCNFVLFTLDVYCVGRCYFFLFDSLREKSSVPLTNSQALHLLTILVARQLKIAAIECSMFRLRLQGSREQLKG